MARRSPAARSAPGWPSSASRTGAASTAPQSQAFIESWRSKLKQRCVWREEFETLDESCEKIGAYVDRYHHRPRSRLAYRTPREVAGTLAGSRRPVNPSGLTDNNDGVHARSCNPTRSHRATWRASTTSPSASVASKRSSPRPPRRSTGRSPAGTSTPCSTASISAAGYTGRLNELPSAALAQDSIKLELFL
jgi:hypothetical protein